MGHLRLFYRKKGLRSSSWCVWRGGGYPGASLTLLMVTLDSHHQYPGPFHRKGTCSRDSHTASFLDRVNIRPWGAPCSQECKPRGPLESAGNPLGEANAFPWRVCVTSLAQSRNCVSLSSALFPAGLGERRNSSQKLRCQGCGVTSCVLPAHLSLLGCRSHSGG